MLAAHLMRDRGIDAEEALACLRVQNPYADPNHRFLDGLAEYGRVVPGS